MRLEVLRKILPAVISRLSLVLLGLGLGLVILELAFRWLYPDPSPKLVNQALQLHDVYGISFTPNAEGWNTSLRGEYSTYVNINSKGLRDKEYSYSKGEDVFRILILGDSFTAGLQVPVEDTFVEALETNLQAQYDKEISAAQGQVDQIIEIKKKYRKLGLQI